MTNRHTYARASSVQLLSHIIAVFVVVLYVSNAYDYLYGLEFHFKPLYWHVLTVGLAGMSILAHSNELGRRYPWPFMLWIGVYLVQLLITYLYSAQTDTTLDLFIVGLQTGALLFAFLVLLSPVTNQKVITRTLIVIVLIAVCTNIYDFLYPTFSGSTGRAAGLYENPNSAGYVISISMVLSCVAVPRKFRMMYCIFVGTGLLLTFSRSSWILWTIGMIGLAMAGKLVLQARLASVLVIGGLSVLVIYALWSGAVLDLFYATGFDRYLDSNTIFRLSGSEFVSQDESINARVEMVRTSIFEIRQHPWFGAGLGATSEWLSIGRPHNLYLLVAVEAGLFGLLVLFALLGLLWRNVDSVGRIAVVMYAVSSLFSHNSLEQAHLLCLIAIVIVLFQQRKWQPTSVLKQVRNSAV